MKRRAKRTLFYEALLLKKQKVRYNAFFINTLAR
jgi:hypothetical protein